jgi:hypothetical protein
LLPTLNSSMILNKSKGKNFLKNLNRMHLTNRMNVLR